MTPQHADAAASAVITTVKVVGIWSAVAAGFTALPWAHIAAALASLYSIHLLVGWWLDRLGIKWERQRRPRGRRTWRNWRGSPSAPKGED
jgi:hypothetical protein